jgi:hypothetical protein
MSQLPCAMGRPQWGLLRLVPSTLVDETTGCATKPVVSRVDELGRKLFRPSEAQSISVGGNQGISGQFRSAVASETEKGQNQWGNIHHRIHCGRKTVHAMDDEEAIRAFEEFVRDLKGKADTNGHHPNPPVNLIELRDMTFSYDWLVESFWPLGTHIHIFASPKTGKSLLMLWIACCICMGRDPFNGASTERQKVSYIDNEMTLKDLRDRIDDMGWDFEQLEGWLKYHSYPMLRPMDTEMGGLDALSMMLHDESQVLIIDTLSRVVQGEENSNDTYRNFYNHTGRVLKANDISMARLDHAGHDPKKSRGASAKADDVDLVYALEKRTDDGGKPGFRLTRTHSRVGFANAEINLIMGDDPIVIRSTEMRSWTLQAITKAQQLDELGAPTGISQRDAIAILKANNYGPGKTVYLAEALKLRLERDNRI